MREKERKDRFARDFVSRKSRAAAEGDMRARELKKSGRAEGSVRLEKREHGRIWVVWIAKEINGVRGRRKQRETSDRPILHANERR